MVLLLQELVVLHLDASFFAVRFEFGFALGALFYFVQGVTLIQIQIWWFLDHLGEIARSY